MANFWHILVNGNEPFVFPSQINKFSIPIILPTHGGRLYYIGNHGASAFISISSKSHSKQGDNKHKNNYPLEIIIKDQQIKTH
jgi:hypothetical protein